MRAALIPVKSFQKAKERLAPVLDAGERCALVRQLAARVIAAAHPLPAFVVCDDEEVAAFARVEGATAIWTPGLGLSGAVRAGVENLASCGFDVVTVAHGDLPLAVSLVEAGRDASSGGLFEVTLVPDRRLDGTNVLTLPARAGFGFAYGPGSFGRHRAEALRLGLDCRIIHDCRLAVDVDLPDDLALVESRR